MMSSQETLLGRAPCMSCGSDLFASGALEVQNLEDVQVDCCSVCGFAFNLRWAPELISSEGTPPPSMPILSAGIPARTLQTLQEQRPDFYCFDGIEPRALLAQHCVQLRRGEGASVILLSGDERPDQLTSLAITLRALELGFGHPSPSQIWIWAGRDCVVPELEALDGLDQIYWREVRRI